MKMLRQYLCILTLLFIFFSCKEKEKQPIIKNEKPKDTIINVEPKDGWENYGTYVSNNFEIPQHIGNQ